MNTAEPRQTRSGPAGLHSLDSSPSKPTRSVRQEARSLVGFLAIFVLSVAVTAALWVAVPLFLSDNGAVAITSASMSPSINIGDVVVYSPHDGVGLEPGTVVTFQPDGGGSLITHRIVSFDAASNTYLTKGDANLEADSTPVRPDQIKGVGWQLVPWAGYPSVWFQNREWVKVIALFVGMFGMLWLSRWGVGQSVRRRHVPPMLTAEARRA